MRYSSLDYRGITAISVISLFFKFLYYVLSPLDKLEEQTVKA